jgi:hypothetical protein
LRLAEGELRRERLEIGGAGIGQLFETDAKPCSGMAVAAYTAISRRFPRTNARASVLHGWAGWRRGTVRFDAPDPAFMPHKYNADRRHHISRPKRRVTNWADYNEALRRRGSLTVWFTEEAIAAWKAAPRTTPGGQPHYSDLAITTALTLRAVFHLPLRQTEGLISSILQLLGFDLPVPDFSTLSRRARSLELPAQPRATGGPIHLLVDSSGLKLGGPGEVAG